MTCKPELSNCPTCGSTVLVDGNVTRYFVPREEVFRKLLGQAKRAHDYANCPYDNTCEICDAISKAEAVLK